MTEQIDLLFTDAVRGMRGAPAAARRSRAEAEAEPGGPATTPQRCLDIFDAQLGSRHLDLAARWLRAQGEGFYTIGSSGHEGNAAVAAALRVTDPALLHYRSGAFFLERARQGGVTSALRDVLLGIVAATEDPIAGGRHKVFGSKRLAVIPQTSTVASHLPRALGVALSLQRARRLGVEGAWPSDAVTVCSFGDASANHSTATGAINAAIHAAYQGIPMPLLLVCEDNGIGISVGTPTGWVRAAYGSRPGLEYVEADGCDLVATLTAADRVVAWVQGAPSSGVPAPADGAPDGPCGIRRRGGVPEPCRDPRRAAARPAPPDRPVARRRRHPVPGRGARPLRGQTTGGDVAGGRGPRAAPAHVAGSRHGPVGASRARLGGGTGRGGTPGGAPGRAASARASPSSRDR